LTPTNALIPYSVNSPLWSDNAHKERFMALPGMSQIDFIEEGAWKFPERAVLVKTFSLDLEAGKVVTTSCPSGTCVPTCTVVTACTLPVALIVLARFPRRTFTTA
jgi:hypothetical protein